MAVLVITLLLLCSMTRDILAASALAGRKTSFSLPAIHQTLDSKLRKRETGTVVANLADINVYNEYSYTCPVIIGGQILNLQFDTGSIIPWVFSSNLPPESLVGHNFFDPTLSPTYQDLNVKFFANYTDSNLASGEIGSDSMSVGGVLVPTQAFGVADTVSQGFVTGPLDGILGLTYVGTLPGTNLNSFLNNVIQSLDSPVFAAYLPHQASGAFDFGEINSDRYTGDILYTKVDDPKGLWKFDSEEYKVGDVTYTSPGVSALVDTASEFIFIQSTQATQYYDAVPNSKYSDEYSGYVYPCTQELPSISFLIGPDNFATVPGANLVTGFKSEDGTICLGGVQPEGSDNGLNVYGLVFVSAFYCIFDLSVLQFGFADIVTPPP